MNDWRAQGDCRGKPQALFFPERDQSISAALAICATCPVLLECRTWGLHHEKIGIWGGTSERERRRLRRQLGIKLREITADDESWKPARAVHLFRQGWRAGEIAIELHAEVRTVHRWLTAGGIDSYPPRRTSRTPAAPRTEACMTALERFTAKYKVDIDTGCWVWQSEIDHRGYGRFWFDHRSERAHRFAWMHFVGPIAAGLHLDHLCRNRACVNPQHLDLVTPSENTLRGEAFSAVNARKIECKHGHPFDEKNTRLTPDGKRRCRTCDRNTRRRRTERARTERQLRRRNAA